MRISGSVIVAIAKAIRATIPDEKFFKGKNARIVAFNALLRDMAARRGLTYIDIWSDMQRDGILPAGMYRNRHYAEAAVDPGSTELAVQDMLYDPQTSGGLLIAAAPEDAEALLRELRGAVPSAQRIGVVEAYQGGPRISLR